MPVRTHPAAASPTRHLTPADVCAIVNELLTLPAVWFDAELGEGEDDAFNYMFVTQIGGPSLAHFFTIDRDADLYTLRVTDSQSREKTIARANTAVAAVWALWSWVSGALRMWGLRVV